MCLQTSKGHLDRRVHSASGCDWLVTGFVCVHHQSRTVCKHMRIYSKCHKGVVVITHMTKQSSLLPVSFNKGCEESGHKNKTNRGVHIVFIRVCLTATVLLHTLFTCCKRLVWRVQGSSKVVCLTGWKSTCSRQYGPSVMLLWQMTRKSSTLSHKCVLMSHFFPVCLSFSGSSAVAQWAQTCEEEVELNDAGCNVLSLCLLKMEILGVSL